MLCESRPDGRCNTSVTKIPRLGVSVRVQKLHKLIRLVDIWFELSFGLAYTLPKRRKMDGLYEKVSM